MKAKISMQQKKTKDHIQSNTMMLMRKILGGVGEANSKDEVKSEASNDEGDPEDESDEEQHIHTYTTKRPKEENILHFT